MDEEVKGIGPPGTSKKAPKSFIVNELGASLFYGGAYRGGNPIYPLIKYVSNSNIRSALIMQAKFIGIVV